MQFCRPISAGAIAVSAFLLGATAGEAHEFWLDVIKFAPKAGESVPVVLRTGQNFLGDSYPFVRARSKRFAVVDARGERPVKAVEGDDPAAEVPFREPGLAILVYHSNPDEVVFETMEKFQENLDYEGLEHIAPEHRRLGKPTAGIRERYSRCAKALVQVGSRTGSDRAVGLPLEIVAEANPYQLAQGMPLPVRVLYEGKPLANILVKVFHGKDPDSPRRLRTDAEGRAAIDLPLAGEYLLSAVHMRAPAFREKSDWTSLWASTTFARP